MNITAWEKIKCSSTIKQWIQEGVPLPFDADNPCVNFNLQNHQLSVTHRRFVDEELMRLSQCGAISEVYSPPRCISPIGWVAKKSGKCRLIVHCHLLEAPFQNEDIQTVASTIRPNDFR
jgi:hypothetical protein